MATTISLSEAPERIKGCCQVLAESIADADLATLSSLFRALGDPTRVQMIHMLKHATEPVCVCDFTAAIDLGQPTVSHHLAKLREAGIVESCRRGIWMFYQLAPDMSDAAQRAVALIP